MKRTVLAGLFACASFTYGATAGAQASAPPDATFTTVDAVTAEGPRIYILGLRSGEEVPAEVRVALIGGIGTEAVAAASACERKALLAMHRPGMYRLEVKSYTSIHLGYCRLVRVAP